MASTARIAILRGFRVQGLGLGSKVWGLGFRVSSFRVWGLGFGFLGLGLLGGFKGLGLETCFGA